jgi:hypothetical protein
MRKKKALKADWRKIAHTLQRELSEIVIERDNAKAGWMLAEEIQKDAEAHSKLNHALLTEALDNLNLWKKIWTCDTRYYYEQARKQADLIAALVEGNKALRAALDKHELFHVKSRELRA